jgi:hypothetical protein
MDKSQLVSTRPPDHLYPLRSHPRYRLVVAGGPTSQGIAGYSGRRFVLAQFDNQGVLTGTQTKPGSEGLETLWHGLRDPDDCWHFMMSQLEFDPQLEALSDDDVVEVRRFTLPELGYGICDFPFRNSQEKMTPEERQDWIESGMYCLYWGSGYYVDRSGSIVAS